MRWSLVILAITSACFFSDPALDRTQFQCDDTSPCPDGQACTNGECTGGVSTSDGVMCGTEGTCGDLEQCCSYLDEECIDLDDECFGNAAACDEPNDCGSGMACCLNVENSTAACGPNSCVEQVCTLDEHCPFGLSCCFIIDAPWGVCADC